MQLLVPIIPNLSKIASGWWLALMLHYGQAPTSPLTKPGTPTTPNNHSIFLMITANGTRWTKPDMYGLPTMLAGFRQVYGNGPVWIPKQAPGWAAPAVWPTKAL